MTMSDKKWTIGLILLFFLFLYVISEFVFVTKRIEQAVATLDQKASSSSDTLHFVLIAQEFDNPYWRKIERGAKDAAGKLPVEVEYIAPLRTSMEEQIKLLEKAIASRVDGIIVQSLNDSAFTPIIDKAISRNIPVITIDTDAPTSQRLSYVGTDNFAAGQLLGKAVVDMTTGEKKIGVIIGSETPESQKLRLNGFTSIIKQHPQFEIIDVKSSNISRIQASIQAEKMLREHPDISVMVGTSALDAIGILIAAKNLQRSDVLIFGFDDLDETLKAISEGKIKATVIQKPYDMGFAAVQLMYNHLTGKTMKKVHFTPIELIDQTNVQLEERP
jgi:ribose transport system substrate-binding protein